MAGGVQERDHAARRFDVVSANVLGNAARFTGRHFGPTNVVEQRGFAMVHVAHDRHHRCARQRFRLQTLHVVVGKGFRVVQRGGHRFVAHFFHHNHGGVLVQRLVDGDHLAELHQVLDHLGRLDAHFVRQFRHGNGFRHMNLKHLEFGGRYKSGLGTCVAVVAAAATRASAETATARNDGRATARKALLLGGIVFPGRRQVL